MARFAIKTPPQHVTWNDLLAVWQEADETPIFESAWVFDHLYPIVGDPAGPCLESWVTLTALAQATSRIRVGSMVNGMHFRHPAVTAKMAASLDHVSAGRLHLGLGAGWFEPEAEAFGLDLGSIDRRMSRFEEGVEVVARLLTESSVDFAGDFYRLQGARCEPRPLQRPRPPIVIGGGGERRTLRVVARWADHWDALRAEGDEWVSKFEALQAHCAAIGRDPSDITKSCHVMTTADADPHHLADQAAQRLAAGVDLVIFSLRAPFDVRMVEPLAGALEQV